jgi:ABC-2 type transport system permease protein
MSPSLTIALKDLRLLWRDKPGLFWVLIFPILMAVLFGSIFSGMGNQASKMKIAVIDRDGSAVSKAFVEQLRKSAALRVQTLPEQEAREAVRAGDLVAFVILPHGFGQSNMFFAGQNPAIDVGIDPSRKAEAGYLQGILAQSTFAAMSSQFSDPAAMRAQLRRSRTSIQSAEGLDAAQKRRLETFLSDVDRFYTTSGGLPPGGPALSGPNLNLVPVIPEMRGPKSAFEISFPQAIVWALLGVVTTFSQSIVRERTAGTLLRLRVAPLTRAQVLAGKGIACFLASASAILFLLALGRVVFAVRFENPLGLAIAILSTSLCFVGLMMLLSVLGRTEAAVAGSGWAVMIILSMFGGGMIPLIAMPQWMLNMSAASPVKWGVLSLEGAIWRDFTLRQMALPCGILLAVGAVSFLVGERVLSRMED